MPKRGFAARVICLCVGSLDTSRRPFRRSSRMTAVVWTWRSCRSTTAAPSSSRATGLAMVNECKSGRMPPLTPDVVAKKLQNEMVFTNDSDVGRVAKLYTRFFDAVTSTTRELSVVSSALLSVVLLLRSSLAAGSAKPAPPLSSCVPSIFCLFVLLSSVASSPRCQRVCPLPGGLRAPCH